MFFYHTAGGRLTSTIGQSVIESLRVQSGHLGRLSGVKASGFSMGIPSPKTLGRGFQLAMSRSLAELFPGFRIWGRAYAEQGKSRRSALEARQLPLPLARVGMRELGFLIGVELIP